ncbi:hypothetical protein V2J09_023013 [Rumex salicifolius]
MPVGSDAQIANPHNCHYPASGDHPIQLQNHLRSCWSRAASPFELGMMEVPSLKALLKNMSSFFRLISSENLDCEPLRKNYLKMEGIFKLLKSILDAIIDIDMVSDDQLKNAFRQLSQIVDESSDLFQNWHPLASRVYLVLQAESLLAKIRSSALEIFQALKDAHDNLPAELSSSSFEQCVQKVKNISCEHTEAIISEAVNDRVAGLGPSPERLVKIADSLGLWSNQEILIEAVALEKLKENAEQAEKNAEVEYLDQLIAVIMCLYDRLVTMKQSQSSTPIPIPADFCCPLSLELMTDPVIVASGQTYERAYIRKWLDLGLNVCPKTRQTLGHTNLIPNYTVKALIANWCELNNVKLPEPMSFNHQLSLMSPVERGTFTVPHSRSDHPTSPESIRPILVEGRSASPQRFHEDRVVTEDSLDIGSLSLENGPNYFDEKSVHSNGQVSLSPSRNDQANVVGAHETGSHGRNRSASDSSTVSDRNLPQQPSGDPSQISHGSGADSSDGSGELMNELHNAPRVSSLPNDSEFRPRLADARIRSQILWRRPSGRNVPRIVPSPATENRPDLSGIESQVKKLMEDLNDSSVERQREATAELRLLAKHDMDNRIVIANCGAINILVSLLKSTDSKIQENAVTALLNLSINDNNKNAIANAEAIEPLIHVLQTGSPEAKENSAATLFSLSVIEENKIKIGRSGAIGPLVDLLGNGTPRGKKDAATALFNLSIYHENKGKIVQAGAVKYLVDLMDPAAGMVDKAVAVLANIATIQEGRNAIGQFGGIPVLVEVVELGSPRGKENAAAALLQLCTSSARFCNNVLQEGAVPPLVALSQSGTARAKEKAQALLSYFRSQRHGNPGRG